MFKKGTLTLIVIIMLGGFITPNTFSYANEIEQNLNINVHFKLDESLVELPIHELKKKDITIYKNEKGRYVVFVPMEDGQNKMQVVSLSEAEQLGYIENISSNIPRNKVVIIEKDREHQFIATIIDKNGYQVKQVISEDEALKLGYVENLANLPKNKKYPIEKGEDGNYFLILIDEDNKKVLQLITEKEAFMLGYEKSKPMNELGSKKNNQLSGILPSTATELYNLLLVGFLLFGLGLVLFLRYQKNH